MPIRNIIGERFGRLVVVKLSTAKRTDKSQNALWSCRCDCGAISDVRSNNLRNGSTTSCGCFHSDNQSRRVTVANTVHGHRTTRHTSPTYITWRSMYARCNNPKHRSYPRYGAVGIRICKRWEKFENFLADMGERPPGKTIDRKNNYGNYTKRNCRWATGHEQRMNQRR